MLNETQVLKEHEDLVQLIRRQLSKNPNLKEDLLQEGRIALVKAARAWRAERETQFRTFASSAVRNAMLNFLQREQEPERASMDESDEAGFTLHDTLGTPPTQEQICEIGEIRQSVSRLSQREQDIVRFRFAEGMSLDETTRHVPLKRTRIDEIEKQAIATLAKRIGA